MLYMCYVNQPLVTSHYMTLLPDLAFIPKARKPVTDQGLEETQTKSIQEESTPVTTGNNIILLIIYMS